MDRAWQNGLEISRQDPEVQRFRDQEYRLVADVRKAG
jgi:hypothetical protein